MMEPGRDVDCRKPLFSVIVPVYNTGRTLKKCVESIQDQSFCDFEILLINDGSTDNSGEICDGLSEIDSRIRVFHKKNGGVSSARNIGLDNAEGTYIVFVDSDDYVSRDMLKIFSEQEADLVVAGFGDYWPENDNIIRYEIKDRDYHLNRETDIVSYLKTGCAAGFVWAKRFSKEIIVRHDIRFHEDQPHSEDILFINEYLLNIKTIHQVDYIVYFHNQYYWNSLSSVAMKLPLIERTHWWKKALDQFEGYPEIQSYYAGLFLFLFEKEVNDIVTSDRSVSDQRKMIRDLISIDSFNRLLDISGVVLPADMVFCCRHKLASCILLKYKLSSFKSGI